MKNLIKLSFICFIVLILVGCGQDELLNKEGIVYQKEYRDIFTEIESDGYNDYKYTYEDVYIIYVKYEKDFSEEYFTTKAFYVSKDIYENINIGDTYLYNSEKDFLKPTPISKVIFKED